MTRKYYELTEEEQELLDEFEKGNFVSVKNFEEQKKFYEKAARNTLNKTRNINIRISERDLHKIKIKAAKEGIPYQTKIASIIHQNTN